MLVVILISTPSRAANEKILEEIVVTATRIALPSKNIGSPVSIIEENEIRRMQHRTLTDVLIYVPGLHSVALGGIGHQTSLFVRGTASNHVLVLIDGIEAGDPSASSGGFDFGNFFLGTVKRVEILRGAQASTHGSEAMGGVVNIVTTMPNENTNRIRIDGGSHGELSQFGEVARKGKNWNFSVFLGHSKSHGESLTAERFSPVGDFSEDDGYENFNGSIRLDIKAYELIDINFVLHSSDTKAELDPTAEDPDANSTATQYLSRLATSTNFLDEQILGTLGISYSHIKREFVNYPDFIVNTFQSTQDTGQRFKFDARADLFFIKNHFLSVGVEYEHEELKNTQFANFSGFIIQGTTSETAVTKTMYIQDTYTWSKNAYITADFRYDNNTRFPGRSTYRISPVVLLPTSGTRLRGAYGTGYRSPALFELFGDTTTAFGQSFQGNRNLRPEETTNWELGIDQALLYSKISVGITYFKSSIADIIVASGFPTIPNNVHEAKINGFEIQSTFIPWPSIKLNSSYTFTSAENSNTGGSLDRRPKHKADLDIHWKLKSETDISLLFHYVGEMNDVGFNGGTVHRGGHSFFNFRLNWKVGQGVQLFTRVNNIFDTKYEVADGFAGVSRSAIIGIERRW